MEYPYLAIDGDGTAWECKTEPFDNGSKRWFTKEFFGSDDSMRKIFDYNENNYVKVFK